MEGLSSSSGFRRRGLSIRASADEIVVVTFDVDLLAHDQRPAEGGLKLAACDGAVDLTSGVTEAFRDMGRLFGSGFAFALSSLRRVPQRRGQRRQQTRSLCQAGSLTA